MRFLSGETGFRHPRIPVIDWVFSTRTSEQEEMFMDVCSILFIFFFVYLPLHIPSNTILDCGVPLVGP